MTNRPPSDLRHPVALGTGMLLVALAVAYALAPSLRTELTREDGVTEWISAALFLAAGIAGVAAVMRSPACPRWSWLLPAAGFVGFGEETAYGARIFGFPLPTLDGEPVDSLHDAFDIAERYLTGLGLRRLHLAAAAVLALAVLGAIGLRLGWHRRVGQWFADHRPVAFVAAAVGLSAAAIVLDLVGRSTTARFVEELFEVAAGGTLLSGVASIGRRRHRDIAAALVRHTESA